MKKNILLIAAALFLFLGNQAVTAQATMKSDVQKFDTETVKVEAKKKTASLVRALNLSDEQQQQVYTLFTKIGNKMQVAKSNSPKDVNAKKAKLNEYTKQKIKEILNEEQYTKYLELAENL